MFHVDISSLVLGLAGGIVIGFVFALFAAGNDSGVPRPRGESQDH